jgi:hypothetical protein
LLVCIIQPYCIQAQETTKHGNNLISAKDAITVSTFNKITWESIYLYHDPKCRIIPAKYVIHDIEEYLSKVPKESEYEGHIKEYNLIKKFRVNIDSLFSDFSIIGNDEPGTFIYNLGTFLPIKFSLYQDTALSMVINGLAVPTSYNTLRSTSRERATQVIESYILPSLHYLTYNFKTNEIKYMGMTVIYGSKDFSDDNSGKSELVGFIARQSLIKKFVKGDITEEELFEKADIYISDRDMSYDVKKVKLTLK